MVRGGILGEFPDNVYLCRSELEEILMMTRYFIGNEGDVASVEDRFFLSGNKVDQTHKPSFHLNLL